jgi:hypothetical protein
MQMLGNLRAAGAILIAYENDGNQAYINLVFTDTGAIFMHKQTGFPNLSPDACRYVNFHVNAAAKQAEIEFFDILGQKLSQHVIPDFSTTWRNRIIIGFSDVKHCSS